MAMGADIQPLTSPDGYKPVAPVSLKSEWATVIDPGGPTVTDNAGAAITDPGLQIDRVTVHDLDLTRLPGTSLLVRVGYNAAATLISQQVVVQLFGADANGLYWPLADENGNTQVTLTADVSADCITQTGGLRASVPIRFDAQGARRVRLGVKIPLITNSGDDTGSVIQVKVI